MPTPVPHAGAPVLSNTWNDLPAVSTIWLPLVAELGSGRPSMPPVAVLAIPSNCDVIVAPFGVVRLTCDDRARAVALVFAAGSLLARRRRLTDRGVAVADPAFPGWWACRGPGAACVGAVGAARGAARAADGSATVAAGQRPCGRRDKDTVGTSHELPLISRVSGSAARYRAAW
jgi:hypothetical protein